MIMEWFARRAKDASKKMKDEEKGFTLIELLVVVIIIGILAAIAIPVFLNQRENAQQSAVVSDARNAATEVQSWGTQNSGDYTGLSEAEFGDVQWSNGNSVDVASISGDNAGFQFTVAPGITGLEPVEYDSTQGGIQD